jgi:hypothetical protein
MGFRFRRSVKIAPGIRLHLSKSGVSASFGRPGATVNVGPRGLKGTVGLPGTGLSWSRTIACARSGGGSRRMSIPDKIEFYRSQGGILSEFLGNLEQFIGQCFQEIKNHGRRNGWPVVIEIVAVELSPGHLRCNLITRSPWEPQRALSPGGFVLATYNVQQRDTNQKMVLGLLDGSNPSMIPSVAAAEAAEAAEQARREAAEAQEAARVQAAITKALGVGCALVAGLIIILGIIGSLSLK